MKLISIVVRYTRIHIHAHVFMFFYFVSFMCVYVRLQDKNAHWAKKTFWLFRFRHNENSCKIFYTEHGLPHTFLCISTWNEIYHCMIFGIERDLLYTIPCFWLKTRFIIAITVCYDTNFALWLNLMLTVNFLYISITLYHEYDINKLLQRVVAFSYCQKVPWCKFRIVAEFKKS